MNRTITIALITIPLGFILEFLAYVFGETAALSTNGVGFLFFMWSALALVGGLASWALCAVTVCAELSKEPK